jgi:hypothetical protein
MNDGLDVSRLESQAKIVKRLAKIAIFSSTTSILVLLYGFIIPDPVIFLTIVLIPVVVMITDNSIENMYQKKIEFLLNDLQTKGFDDDDFASRQTATKQSNYPNSAFLRIRGGDEKGPAFGKDHKNFSTHSKRIDATANRDFDNLETISTDNEKMIRVADEIQSEIAAEQWSKSESMDKDLIEAGVNNLGDLIKTGWFEKNKQDDAVERLYEKSEGNQI